jgi:hypothetical protein
MRHMSRTYEPTSLVELILTNLYVPKYKGMHSKVISTSHYELATLYSLYSTFSLDVVDY